MTNENVAKLPVDEPEALLTYAELARRLRMPVGTLQYLVSRGDIPHLRLGPRSVRFRPGEIEGWLDRRTAGGRTAGKNL